VNTAPRPGEEDREALAALPPLREALAPLGLSADKRFGQHFLFDLNLCRKIAQLAGPLEGRTVIEVGPGPGGLTRALLEAGARVVSIEKDPRFAPVLAGIAEAAPGRLTVVEADALEIDEAGLLRRLGIAAQDVRVAANLPYNIGTPLLVKWLVGAWRPQTMTLMFQTEVARRIVAAPGAADYGRLAVLTQSMATARIALAVPARAFTPPPKVESSVVRIDALPSRLSATNLDALQAISAAAFGQRRKMLRSSLRALGGEALCVAAGLDPSVRAETVDIPGFLRLADAWLGREAQAPSSMRVTKGASQALRSRRSRSAT
jgi:16S rRNA (adenine1518-N6/adenine1519-N6)-dimethyltransferase